MVKRRSGRTNDECLPESTFAEFLCGSAIEDEWTDNFMSSLPDQPATKWLDAFGLNDRQRSFVLIYLNEPNSTKAARQAGYKHPNTQGPRLLVNVCIAAAVQEGRTQIECKLMYSAQDIARCWLELATADPSELSNNLLGACRYCHGIDFEYQWKSPREYRDALARVVYDFFAGDDLRAAAMRGEIEDLRLPTDIGGFGYRISDDPNPDCPECAGLGIEHVRMADTSTLTGSAKLLFDGVETTRQSKKIKVQSRERALENLAKHLGMFSSKVEAEEINPLSRLVDSLLDKASTVPVATQPSMINANTRSTTDGPLNPGEP